MFSYTLVLALLLLFPGLCAWAGVRAGERSDFLSPRPDLPNSTSTLAIVVGGTIGGHTVGALLFAGQSLWCDSTGWCVRISFDPNVYRVLISANHAGTLIPDVGIAWWLVALGAIGIFTGWLALTGSRWDRLKGKWDAVGFGWLQPAVAAVKRGDSVVVAYVVTKTSYDGASVAYEGMVQQLAIDSDQRITMIVLRRVDRFLTKITEEGLVRLDSDHQPIAQMQLRDVEIANVALEIVTLPE
jgi:hypothetical protein